MISINLGTKKGNVEGATLLSISRDKLVMAEALDTDKDNKERIKLYWEDGSDYIVDVEESTSARKVIDEIADKLNNRFLASSFSRKSHTLFCFSHITSVKLIGDKMVVGLRKGMYFTQTLPSAVNARYVYQDLLTAMASVEHLKGPFYNNACASPTTLGIVQTIKKYVKRGK